MAQEQLVQVLRRVDLLEGVPEETLALLCEVGRPLTCAASQYVVRQGEYGDSFYVVLSGKVAVEVVGDDGKSKQLASLSPGDYFGELAMVGHGERTASVRGLVDTQLLELRQVPFQATLKKHRQVRTRLETAYARRALMSFVRRSRYFRDLPPDSIEELISTSRIEEFRKNDQIVEEGGPAHKFYIIRSGFVRVTRRVGAEEQHEIVAYLGPDDFFGDQELAAANATYATTVVALEPVQAVVVTRSTFWRLHQDHPEIFTEFRRYEIRRQRGQSILQSSATSMAFVQEVLEAGLGQARSALIIDMDHCVRCGNCVQACDDLHGFSRLARRGKRMTRRVSLESTSHEHLFFPTSCLQCATPECMVGCPTGAISRDPGGEVFIRDTCIGCGSCARNCDFGNISMAQLEGEDSFSLLDRALGKGQSRGVPDPEGQKLPAAQKKSDLIAVKCDVCFQREFAACVYNCPTSAILRIDPREYFQELRQIVPKSEFEEQVPTKTQTRRPTRWFDGLLQIMVALLATVGGYWLWQIERPTQWHGLGWYSGIGAASLMFMLGTMGVRKRLRTQALGSLFTWARVHAVLGGLFVGVALFHAGYAASSVLNATLLAMVVLVCFVGASGQIANALVPRLIARIQDESLLPEDLAPRIRSLSEENEELLEVLDADARSRVEKQVRRLASGIWACFIMGHSPKMLGEVVADRAKKLPVMVEKEHAISQRVARNLMTARLHRLQSLLETFLISWVPLHLVGTCILVLLLAGHIMTVALW